MWIRENVLWTDWGLQGWDWRARSGKGGSTGRISPVNGRVQLKIGMWARRGGGEKVGGERERERKVVFLKVVWLH